MLKDVYEDEKASRSRIINASTNIFLTNLLNLFILYHLLFKTYKYIFQTKDNYTFKLTISFFSSF